MTRKERDFITLRFRKKLDDDLREAVSNLEDVILSDLVRDGLRLMLGIRTTKKIQVTETALFLPASLHDINQESPAEQGNEPVNADPQRPYARGSSQQTSTQQKAARFPEKPPAPYMPNNPKHRN